MNSYIKVFRGGEKLMDADNFWSSQFIKNETGKPKYTVSTFPDTPEEEFMGAWIDKWHEHFDYFNNGGCGCCINIYEFDAPQQAVMELQTDWIELHLYEELHRPPRTGSQSSFREFSRTLKDWTK